MMANHILRNLYSLIRNATMTYQNEFVWQDIQLTVEFQKSFKRYLNKNHYDIEYFDNTAAITSSSGKFIFVPNQWFVIASYAVEVYEELYRYKNYFLLICENLQKKPKEFAPYLRDYPNKLDEKIFVDCAKEVFKSSFYTQEEIDEATRRLWRFVNDYAWWSGQKTIDRTDFHVSVILNMLNLVAVSQGYVADIVAAYANDATLRKLVSNIDGFTLNYSRFEDDMHTEYLIPDIELNRAKVADSTLEYATIPKPQRTRIRIKGTNKMKEVKYDF